MKTKNFEIVEKTLSNLGEIEALTNNLFIQNRKELMEILKKSRNIEEKEALLESIAYIDEIMEPISNAIDALESIEEDD